jgi:hypothetical protein
MDRLRGNISLTMSSKVWISLASEEIGEKAQTWKSPDRNEYLGTDGG